MFHYHINPRVTTDDTVFDLIAADEKLIEPGFACYADAENYAQTLRFIPLTQDKWAIVDAADYDFLMQWKWYFSQGYAQRSVPDPDKPGRQRAVRLHNAIMQPAPNFIIDHINRNRLDNRRCNLRPATYADNTKNASPIVRTSIYKGVHWHKATGKWAAKIRSDNRPYHLGIFLLETDAAHAYDYHARRMHGEYAVLNFPDVDLCPERSDDRDGSPGELHSKLTAADVIAIRRRYAAERPALKTLAAEYGVAKSNICLIVNGKTWQHLL